MLMDNFRYQVVLVVFRKVKRWCGRGFKRGRRDGRKWERVKGDRLIGNCWKLSKGV
jgi:hypothetical protein